MYGYEFFTEYLKRKRIRYEETDTLISFKHKGRPRLVLKDKNRFLIIIMLCKFDKTQQSQFEILELCNKINAENYGIKLTCYDDTIWTSYEMYTSENTPDKHFELALKFVDSAADRLIRELK